MPSGEPNRVPQKDMPRFGMQRVSVLILRCLAARAQSPPCPPLLKGGKADSPLRKRGVRRDLLALDSPTTEKRGTPRFVRESGSFNFQ
jgi:hypothetical protein